MLAIAGFLITLSFRRSTIYDPADFQFSADKIYSEGVPNSVIFSYDAAKAQTDSVFIVQTWDIRRKTIVPREGRKHSAIYYYPGFFRTKLIVEEQVMKTHDLQITSDGWLGLMELPGKPLYFEKEEILSNDGVTISTDLLHQYEIPLNPVPPKIRIFNQGDLGDLMNDHFTFETELKNDFKSGINTCQYVEVLIQCKDDIIIIPLVSVACVGDAYLYAAGVSRESKDADLSGFGADLSQWTHLKVQSKDKQLTFFVNGIQAESFVFPNQPTGVVGVQYRFNGPGSVKFARFREDGDWLTLN